MVGDTFTYELAGSTVLGSDGAVTATRVHAIQRTNYYQEEGQQSKATK
ncbi:MAG: hypothetical protein ACLQO7_06435 [Candidatus Bathyarchaeia archaeon]